MSKRYSYYLVTRKGDGKPVDTVPVNGDRRKVRAKLSKKYPVTDGYGISLVTSDRPLDDPHRFASSFDAFKS